MVYVDTNILIYLFENHPEYGKSAAGALTDLQQHGHEFVTSVLTITECLAGTKGLALSTLQNLAHMRFVVVDEAIATTAADLQRGGGLKIGDAIHLATALQQKAGLLLTNDAQLVKVAKKHLAVQQLAVYE